MGEVYRARDIRLDRDVALKVLPSGVLANDAARRLFGREARALGKLTHPNIAVLHDYDTHEGMVFLVMELVEGESLARRLERGPMAEGEILRLGIQLTNGLVFAHEHGVLHCDLKPSNLHWTESGHLKILDFGLARWVRASAESVTETVTAGLAGTLAYLPPEVLLGRKPNARSDIYAAGAVLYELATGQRPFRATTPGALTQEIVSGELVPPRRVRPGLSGELERVILRALDREPSRRYGSPGEFAHDLERLAVGSASATRADQSSSRIHSRALTFGVIGVVLLGTLLVGREVVRRALPTAPTHREIQSLAVLPLANLSGDPGQDYFSDGLTEELMNQLAQVTSLRIVARSSVMALKGSRESAMRIGRKLGVGLLIEGSVVRSGGRVRVSAELINAKTERVEWARSYDRKNEDVLDLQSEVAQAIVREIHAQVTPREAARLSRSSQVAPEALEAYLRGRHLLTTRDIDRIRAGLQFFEEATRIDSTYAAGWAGVAYANYVLANLYLPVNQAMPRAKAAAERALALDPDLAEAHLVRGIVLSQYEWKFDDAEASFRRSIGLNPSLAEAHSYLGMVLLNRRHFEQALQEYAAAQKQDPLDADLGGVTGWCLYYMKRFPEAEAQLTRLSDEQPDNADLKAWVALCLLRRSAPDSALILLREANRLADHAWPIGQYGWGCGVLKRPEEARVALRRLLNPTGGVPVNAVMVAQVYLGLGERDHVFEWLEKAYVDRSEDLLLVGVDPAWDPVRDDARYQNLLRRMHLR